MCDHQYNDESGRMRFHSVGSDTSQLVATQAEVHKVITAMFESAESEMLDQFLESVSAIKAISKLNLQHLTRESRTMVLLCR